MTHYSKFNDNPEKLSVGDCTVRAISKALDQSWDKTYVELCVQGYLMCDMPSANHVWGAYLKGKGFRRYAIPHDLPDNYCVDNFCADNPYGTFILACNGHVVAVVNGRYYDSWNSGYEIPLYYWEREV